MQLFDELATRLFDRPEMSENTPPMATALDVNWLADSSQRNSERCYWSVCDECCRARGDEAQVCLAGSMKNPDLRKSMPVTSLSDELCAACFLLVEMVSQRTRRSILRG